MFTPLPSLTPCPVRTPSPVGRGRSHRAGGEGAHFTRTLAVYDLPKTNPFLRKLFAHIAGPELDERIVWAVDNLAELLARADIAAILQDFGRATKQEGPVAHFYETFLGAYDQKMREARGVYYTPEPVVSTRYDTDHISEAQFEPGSRGRVLKNLLSIRSKRC